MVFCPIYNMQHLQSRSCCSGAGPRLAAALLLQWRPWTTALLLMQRLGTHGTHAAAAAQGLRRDCHSDDVTGGTAARRLQRRRGHDRSRPRA